MVRASHSFSNARLFPRTTRRFRPASAPDNSACNSPIQQGSKPGPHRTGKRKRGQSSIDIPMSIELRALFLPKGDSHAGGKGVTGETKKRIAHAERFHKN